MEKTDTRKLAEKFKLKTAQKTESQDICFVPGSVEEFLEGKLAFEPGNIVDSDGHVLGEHRGLTLYTIGQRRGLGGGFTEIMYVTGLNKEKNEVIIGTEEELFNDSLIVEKPHWVFEEPKMPLKCTAKIRYQSQEAKCTVNYCSNRVRTGSDSSSRTNSNNNFQVTFAEPQKAITPGQSVVFYDGDYVIGGGIIK